MKISYAFYLNSPENVKSSPKEEVVICGPCQTDFITLLM